MSKIVKCNYCENAFLESAIVYDKEADAERCPYCGQAGCLMDGVELEDVFPKASLEEKLRKRDFVHSTLSSCALIFGYEKCEYALVFDNNWNFIGEKVLVYGECGNVAFSVNVTATSIPSIMGCTIAAMHHSGDAPYVSYTNQGNVCVLKEVKE